MTIDEVLQELKQNNEPVPKPLRLPTIEEVAAVEQRLDVIFQPDYRKFLLEASNVTCGVLEPATATPAEGHTDLVEIVESAWYQGVPRDWLPICEDNGDYYCLNRTGQVVFWSHNGPTDETWPDLATWIKEVWLEEAS